MNHNDRDTQRLKAILTQASELMLAGLEQARRDNPQLYAEVAKKLVSGGGRARCVLEFERPSFAFHLVGVDENDQPLDIEVFRLGEPPEAAN